MNLKSDVLSQLASTHYKADLEQIEELARLNVTSMGVVEGVRGGYLKALVAATQATLKGQTRKRGEAALAAVEAAHGKFYAAVLRGITTKDVEDKDSLPQEERSARAIERNRRSNFARVAKSAVVAFVRAGGDVLTLTPDTVTRNELKSFALSMAARRAPVAEVARRVAMSVEQVEQIVRELADRNKDAAVESLQEAMQTLSELLGELGRNPTKRAAVAVREARPFKMEVGDEEITFFPIPAHHDVENRVQ